MKENCAKKVIKNLFKNSYKVYEVTPQTESDVNFLQSLANNENFDFWSLQRAVGVKATVMVKPNRQKWFEYSLKTRQTPFTVSIDDLEKYAKVN